MDVLNWPKYPRGNFPISGAELPMDKNLQDFQYILRDFTLSVARPTGIKLDRMSPVQAIAKGSPFWEFREKYLCIEKLAGLSVDEHSLSLSLLFEELGYGDAGLAISMGVGFLPQTLAAKFKNHFLMERFPDTSLGCWGGTALHNELGTLNAITESLNFEIYPDQPACRAKKVGKKIIINGKKSAWVSNGSIADVCILYCPLDLGEGKANPDQGYVVLIPMDSQGITHGKVLDKHGQRALNQSELFFDNVELSMDYVLAKPDAYHRSVYCIDVEVNTLMGSIYTGVAQSACDIALEYVREHRQYENSTFNEQYVDQCLFNMYRKVEMARALSRRVCLYNNSVDVPSLNSAMMTKISSSKMAFDVANDAMKIFGVSGLSKEYLIEKILRDSRSSLTEGGCNDILAIKGGNDLINSKKRDIS